MFADWRDLIACDIDAVLALTSGSHAPIAVAAAEAGRHLLIEKPMCFWSKEGKAMIAAAERAGVVTLVGYNKRYDPAYRRLQDEAKGLKDLRLARVTTLELPFQPYVAHYRLQRVHLPQPMSPRASKLTMRHEYQRRSATPMTCRAGRIIWSCWIPWCMSSTQFAACWASRTGWSSPTSGRMD